MYPLYVTGIYWANICTVLIFFRMLACSFPLPALALRNNRAPGWWLLVVVGQGDSSGGCGFTTYCATGLSLDAGVIPLAAGEMSCLLPFPNTPKPNEQHGVHPAAVAPTELPLWSFSFYIRLLPASAFPAQSVLHAAVYLILITAFLLAPPSIHPSNHQFILLCFLQAFALSPSAPHYVASALRGWQSMTWQGLRG